jgi:hypothetical protein
MIAMSVAPASPAAPVAPRIALIHATRLAVDPVNLAFERLWPDARRMNLLDDSLSVDLARDGRLTPAMTRRFETLALYARDAGCHGVLFTCSAFGPAIDAAARACGLPTLKPNEAMFAQAVAHLRAHGGRAALVATFEPSIAPMGAEFAALAAAAGLRDPGLATVVVPGAMQALAAGDATTHDAAIADAVAALDGVDLVMLAQFSMAAAGGAARARTRALVLTSPDCAVTAMRSALA